MVDHQHVQLAQVPQVVAVEPCQVVPQVARPQQDQPVALVLPCRSQHGYRQQTFQVLDLGQLAQQLVQSHYQPLPHLVQYNIQ
jgi:hypothetical protein